MADAIQLGREAEYILNSEAFKIAASGLERTLMDNWAAGVFKTTEEREEAFHRVRAAIMLRQQLEAAVSGMKVEIRKNEDREKRERVRGA